MKLRIVFSFLLGAAAIVLFAFIFMRWYLGGSTPVTLENRSGQLLNNVTISGSGFKATLGEIGPNKTVRARVYPAGESTIHIAFSANGRDVSIPLDVYFEGGGGYILDVVVDRNLRASVFVDSFTYRSMLLP